MNEDLPVANAEIVAEDVQMHCRCCLKKFTGASYNIEKMTRPMFKLFRYCTGFRIWQKGLYPEGICSQCNDLLKSFEKFCDMCKQSSYFLEELLNGQRISDLPQNELEKIEKNKKQIAKESQNQIPLGDIEMPKPITELDPTTENTPFENIVVKPEVEVKTDIDFGDQHHSDSDFDDYLGLANFDENEIKSEGSSYEEIENKESLKNTKMLYKQRKLRNKKVASKTKKEKEKHQEKAFELIKEDQELQLHVELLPDTKDFQNPLKSTSVLEPNETLQKEDVNFENILVMPKETCDPIDNISDSDLEDSLALNVLIQKKLKATKSKKVEESIKELKEVNSKQKSKKLKDTKISKVKTKSKLIETSSSETETDDFDDKPEKPKVNCEQCPRKFKWPFELRRHIKEAHGEKPLELPCKYACGKVFRSQNTLKSHYRINHQMKKQVYRENAYICEQCGKGFKRLPLLERHRFHHLPPDARPYKCEQCGKTFVMERIYKEHLLRHSDQKKFECPHCDIKKATLGELKEHVNIHTKEKVYACKLCPKVFYRSKTLVQHVRAVHEGIKKHFCRFCQHSFANHINLVHHERIHTGEKPYSCEICERSFIQPSALKTHMKTHDETRVKMKVGRKPKNSKTKEDFSFDAIINDNLQQINTYSGE